MEITREEFSWVFEKGDRPSLVISKLEALAILVALKLRFGEQLESDDTSVLIVPSITDNRGEWRCTKQVYDHAFPILRCINGAGDQESEGNENGGRVGAPRVQQGSRHVGDTTFFDLTKRLEVSARTLLGAFFLKPWRREEKQNVLSRT